jgi:mono/diheme cytochrome c family protein
MKSRICLAVLVTFALCPLAFTTQAEPGASKETPVQRGQYLVEHVAMCADCHTPHTERGEYDRNAWLAGSVLAFKPSQPMPFAPVSPKIAGLPTFPTDEQAVKFLETGTNALGRTALPPMPQYRLNHDDAVAVVAYLRSLKK